MRAEVIKVKYEHIKEIRVANGIKQQQIAEYLNVAQNTYSQYETGRISLTGELLIKLADYYKVSVDYLLDRTERPK